MNPDYMWLEVLADAMKFCYSYIAHDDLELYGNKQNLKLR